MPRANSRNPDFFGDAHRSRILPRQGCRRSASSVWHRPRPAQHPRLPWRSLCHGPQATGPNRLPGDRRAAAPSRAGNWRGRPRRRNCRSPSPPAPIAIAEDLPESGIAQDARPGFFRGGRLAADMPRHVEIGPHGGDGGEILAAMTAQGEARGFEDGDGGRSVHVTPVFSFPLDRFYEPAVGFQRHKLRR